MSAQILQIRPDATDINGDAQNALVLARRARWASIDVEVMATGPSDGPAAVTPAAVVIGSSVDAELRRLRDALESWRPALQDWIAGGVPVLAVGTGMELLAERIVLADGDRIEGLGLLPGSAEPLADRAVGDLAVADGRELLIGYENHARGLTLPGGAVPLGRVERGQGNGSGREGVRVQAVVGTHLHGPVLAKNPSLADEMLTIAFGTAYSPDAPGIRRADETARAARSIIAGRLSLTSWRPSAARGPNAPR